MQTLIDFIKDKTGAAYVDTDGSIFDGCFTLSPWRTDALVGNGEVAAATTSYDINLFFTQKIVCAQIGLSLFKELMKEPGITCDSPTYNYEKDGGLWRCLMSVQKVG